MPKTLGFALALTFTVSSLVALACCSILSGGADRDAGSDEERATLALRGMLDDVAGSADRTRGALRAELADLGGKLAAARPAAEERDVLLGAYRKSEAVFRAELRRLAADMVALDELAATAFFAGTNLAPEDFARAYRRGLAISAGIDAGVLKSRSARVRLAAIVGATRGHFDQLALLALGALVMPEVLLERRREGPPAGPASPTDPVTLDRFVARMTEALAEVGHDISAFTSVASEALREPPDAREDDAPDLSP